MPTDSPWERRDQAASAAIVAAGSAALGLTGHPLDLIVGAPVLAAMQPYLDAMWERIADVFRHAGIRAAKPVDDVVAELMSSASKQELYGVVLDVARTAATEEKRRVLAAVLVAGADENDAALTQSLLIARAVSDLETPHMAVLAKLNEPPLESAAPTPGSAGASQGLMWGINGWRSTPELRAVVQGSSDLLIPILATLERHGLVEQTEPEGMKFRKGEVSWRLTPHGRFLMEDLLGTADE